MRLQRTDDHRRHVRTLGQRVDDLVVVEARRAHVGVVDLQRPSGAAWHRGALHHRQRAQRCALAQVELLYRLPGGVGQRLHHGGRPQARRVEQRDHRRRAAEVGAAGREVVANRLCRRTGHEHVDHVRIGFARHGRGHGFFEHRGGRERHFGRRIAFGAHRTRNQLTEQGLQHA
jgi:hypothetical protein